MWGIFFTSYYFYTTPTIFTPLEASPQQNCITGVDLADLVNHMAEGQNSNWTSWRNHLYSKPLQNFDSTFTKEC